MPNTGRPSRDCHLCRQRRVKCDLGRPACQRCIKYGQPCPGYRSQQDLLFRVTTSTSPVHKRKRAPAATSDGDAQTVHPRAGSSASDGTTPSSHGSDAEDGSSSAVMQLLAIKKTSPPLLLQVQESWKEHSIPLVMQCYGHLDFIRVAYENSPAEACLTSTAQLFARVFMANHFLAPLSQNEMQYYLSKALGAVAEAVQDPVKSLMDSTIVAVMMLWTFEVVVGSIGRHSNVEDPWHVHSQGLLSLLRARGPSQLLTPQGRGTFWAIYAGILTQCVVSNLVAPPETAQWLAILKATLHPEEEFLFRVATYLAKITPYLHQMARIVREADFEDAALSLPLILQELDAAEHDLSTWVDAHPEFTDPDPLKTPGRNYSINSWRSAHIKINYFIVLVTNMIQYAPPGRCPISYAPEFLDQRRRASIDAITAASKQVLDATLQVLDAVDGGAASSGYSPASWFLSLQLVFPLTCVMIIPVVPKESRITARYVLGVIGRKRGILQALKQYPGGMYMPPEALKGLPEDDGVFGTPIREAIELR